MTRPNDPVGPGLAAPAGLTADGTRASFLPALLGGRARTTGELARHAGEHLGKLVAGGLLTEERQARHRHVRLADAGAAQFLEDLAAHGAPRATAPPDAAGGRRGLGDGQGPDLLRPSRRPARHRPHRHALDSRWCVRVGSERAVKVTPDGERAFADLLGAEAAALR